MAILLPILGFLFVFFSLQMREQCHDSAAKPEDAWDWRDSFMVGSAIWAVVLTALTEILSVSKAFNLMGVLLSWATATGLAGFFYFRKIGKRKIAYPGIEIRDPFLCFLGAGIFVILSVTALIAWKAPPNTWDSMTYHMSRVAHWIQNQSVAHYPTSILRQLFLSPGAEFAAAHFQVLSGSDHFANFVQWFAFLGCIVGVSATARHLGLNSTGQIYASVICATIPMAVLQASSTQNDLVHSFWLVVFVYSLIRLTTPTRFQWCFVGTAGAGLGLAYLTKGVAYIYSLPFLIAFIGFLIWQKKLWDRAIIKSLAAILTIALLINLGHFVRNERLFHSLFGPVDSLQVTSVAVGPRIFLSNVIRNIGSHIGTPFPDVNHAMEQGIRWLHSMLSLDVDDARIKLSSTQYYLQGLNTNEATAGNPVHLVLIFMTAAILLFSKSYRRDFKVMRYFLCVVAASVLFSLCFRWQHWTTRLQLPLFVLWAPLTALVISKAQKKWAGQTVMALLLLASFWWVGYSYQRGLVKLFRPKSWPAPIWDTSRAEQYFYDHPEVKTSYLAAVNFIQGRGYHKIGLVLGRDDWEYPFWVFLRGKGVSSTRIEHVHVSNESGGLSDLSFSPEVVVCSLSALTKEVFFEYQEKLGPPLQFGYLLVFSRR